MIKHYALPDAEGYVVSIGTSVDIPNGCVELQAEIPERPTTQHRFHLASWQWVDTRTPQQIADEQWQEVRRRRNSLLAATDWTDTASAPARLGQTAYDSWQTYRQALRDVTTQSDPFNIVWPTRP